MSVVSYSRVSALLGPTNTGKTHRAIERLLSHRSGMIGLPLRLLAREVYDKVVAARGADSVALITGEEKRVPASPRYYVCTVEAMPLDVPVAFLCVDEVQLASDRTRGHVFTDRLLRARGVVETMFLGSSTIAPLLPALVPGVEIESAPRLSRLSYAGCRKLTSLPPRSAIIAFSAEEVIRHAERLRAVQGGAAVVLGALSPRTRNAQVELYQSGEVQHIVATDAIGMGLNMDIAHVAFTALRKYDGRGVRDLAAAEIAQIAGRAGRYRADGTFGATRELGELDPTLVDALERHDFPPLSRLYYRNGELDFRSPAALVESLTVRPPLPFLMPIEREDDQQVLEDLLERSPFRERVRSGGEPLERLWEVCRVPDFRKTLTTSHADLLAEIAAFRVEDRPLPADWVAQRLDRLDRTEGDIETLMARIAWVRTWTYVTNQRGWLEDAFTLRDRALRVEDRLSDALHDALTARFVDRRVLMFAGDSSQVDVEVDDDGIVGVGGDAVGVLRDLSFVPATSLRTKGAMGVMRRSLRPRALVLLERLRADPAALRVDDEARIRLDDVALGSLVAGESALLPAVKLGPLELLDAAEREEVRRLLHDWRDRYVASLFAALDRPVGAAMSPAGRGVVYQLREGLGSVERSRCVGIDELTDPDRKALARLDVRVGLYVVYVHSMLKADPLRQRALLWSVAAGRRPVDRPPPHGRTTVPAEGVPDRLLQAVGYRALGGLAVRVDIIEKVAAFLRAAAGRDHVDLEPLTSFMGCSRPAAERVARALGYRVTVGEGGAHIAAPVSASSPRKRRRRTEA